jgi:Protein kinase domain
MGDSKKRLPISAPKDNHFVLHYNSNRPAFTGHTAAVVEKYFRPFVVVVMVVLGICVSLFGWVPLLVYFLAFVCPLVFVDLARPTNLELDPAGLRFYWLHPLLFFRGPKFPWSSIRAVSYHDVEMFSLKTTKCLDIVLNTSSLDAYERFLFEIMATTATLSYNADETTIRLVESGFFQESDQICLRSALLQYVPSELVDEKLAAREEFGQIPTYTGLWLSSLHSASRVGTILPPGTQLAEGRYEIISRLGSGGQATVYEALDLGDPPQSTEKQKCVLKEFVLPVRGGRETEQRAVENIRREANSLKSLDRPNIVKFRNLFIEGPRAYLVMENVDGTTLRQQVENDGQMASARVVQLAIEMTELLKYLHQQNPPLIHRDFTPDNLMLTEDGHLTLIDFNVAYRLESKSTNTVVGQHAYVPPEQFRGKATIQSDIYAMGATVYFLLTAEDPEPLSTSDPRTKVPDVPEELSRFVTRCTETDATLRYSTADDARKELQPSGPISS